MSTHVRRLLPYAPYLLLGLLVMGPLLLPGFVLTMDMVFTPVLRMPAHVDNTWLFYTLLHVFNLVIPADVLQKVMLLSVFVLSGIGAHRLLSALRPQGQARWSLALRVGSVLYEINPFVYDRLMAGQYGVLLGYALLPWFALSLWKFVQKPGWKAAAYLALWVTALSIVSIHSLGFVVVLAIVVLLACVRDRQKLKHVAMYGAGSVGLFLIASSYWLLPAAMGQGRIADSLSTFTESGRAAFATVDINGLTPLGSVLGLQGFWQETRGLAQLPSDGIWIWEEVQLALWILLGIGAWQAWHQQRKVASVVSGVAIVSIILALGIGGEWLATHVPFFAGYREPQKFVALLSLAYAYFATWGAIWIFMHSKKRFAKPTLIAMVMLPLLYTPTLLWGAHGQLRAAAYPSDWFTANRILDAQPGTGKVLVLPWHLYMSYGHAGRIIASPAASFYDRAVVTSDDPELPGVAPQTHDVTREAVSRLLGLQDEVMFARELQALGVDYVLVNKELDYRDYDFISSVPGVQVLQDSQTLKLYRLTNDTIRQHENN